MFLGPSASVLSLRRDESMRIKQEYHAFRNRSAYTMFAFAAALHALVRRARRMAEANVAFTLTPVVMVGIQLFLCWLLFFYVAAALRESVLKLNGSHIRPWWIHHHYWAMATAVLMLSLPVDSPSFVRSVTMFLWWAMMQAVVIVAQNRYQRRRMYTRIALGKNSAMDVVSGETSGAHGQLLLLYPMLFAMQALQASGRRGRARAQRGRGHAGAAGAGGLAAASAGRLPASPAAGTRAPLCPRLILPLPSPPLPSPPLPSPRLPSPPFALVILQAYLGVEMMRQTYPALLSTEGFLDPERKESDLWGSRGVALAGAMMLYMAFRNFVNTAATIIDKRGSRERAVSRLAALRARSAAGPSKAAAAAAAAAPGGPGPSSKAE
jgi:hypothetical protein